MEEDTFSFCCERLLKPSSLLWFCRRLPSIEMSMRTHAARIHIRCFVGWSLLGGKHQQLLCTELLFKVESLR